MSLALQAIESTMPIHRIKSLQEPSEGRNGVRGIYSGSCSSSWPKLVMHPNRRVNSTARRRTEPEWDTNYNHISSLICSIGSAGLLADAERGLLANGVGHDQFSEQSQRQALPAEQRGRDRVRQQRPGANRRNRDQRRAAPQRGQVHQQPEHGEIAQAQEPNAKKAQSDRTSMCCGR